MPYRCPHAQRRDRPVESFRECFRRHQLLNQSEARDERGGYRHARQDGGRRHERYAGHKNERNRAAPKYDNRCYETLI
jgi:hypothetical protein